MNKVFVVLVNSAVEIGIALVTINLSEAVKTARSVEDLGYIFTMGKWAEVCYLGLERVCHAQEFSSMPAKEFGEKSPVVIFSRFFNGTSWLEEWYDDEELLLLAGEMDCFQ